MNRKQFLAAMACYAIVFIPLACLVAACLLPDTQVAHILAVIDSAKG